ncbi:ATP-binding cassette domain-containing protein [Amycolatopsis azurea]|uniref:ABC transporter ATP-binding protein n=1 Tax=Amycolatopsis azurea DSM 43854 TaxID=1238180 RepID=M2QGB4_9PSEU|nr:ABC transporter ATP-binding protein [Amycolatopsis azurea]EMD25022.1 Oligopeptide transport ATP-binding protein OppD [Amycolatopsis azurea DSM 43854]OOC05293.1 ABC transporter ATP-binding protein [Amycolatopsis azurea DSM 43854]
MTLEVHDLAIGGLVRGVSFAIARGERVGLIGESGSGKSLTALSIMGLLPEELAASGSVKLDGRELLGAPEKELSRLRGNDLSMVFQEPMTALNPAMRVGAQVAEPMRIHRDGGKHRAAAEALLESVGLPGTFRAYPHQLSGGQRQRVVLAIALANDPKLLICDEPTTALDVTVQAQILELILDGVRERESALLFITHDLAVVASVCERVLVMLDGEIVEAGTTRDVLTAPQHEYTMKLLAASDLEASR